LLATFHRAKVKKMLSFSSVSNQCVFSLRLQAAAPFLLQLQQKRRCKWIALHGFVLLVSDFLTVVAHHSHAGGNA
jgi:hypothetical protein